MATSFITQLTLQDFRNYRWCQLQVEAKPVVLAGHNGAGKTNILEAISLLIPGKGCRGADFPHMARQQEGQCHPWAVGAELHGQAGICQLGTQWLAEERQGRRFLMDGEPLKNRNLLSHVLGVLWLTPDMDSILRDTSSIRRRFMDKLVAGFDAEHSTQLNRYEQAMRERNKLLSFSPVDAVWLKAVEARMVEAAVIVAEGRLRFLQQWQAAVDAGGHAFPQAQLALQGEMEQWLQQGTAADAETAFARTLHDARRDDAAAGRTLHGIHRTELQVTHREKQCPAVLCSTGEQKALLLSLILAVARVRHHDTGYPPLLLLDEVVAHLDSQRRQALFDEIMQLGAQAWMTGTDVWLFEGIAAHAQLIQVEAGQLHHNPNKI